MCLKLDTARNVLWTWLTLKCKKDFIAVVSELRFFCISAALLDGLLKNSIKLKLLLILILKSPLTYEFTSFKCS